MNSIGIDAMKMRRNVKAMASGLGLVGTLLISSTAMATEFSVPHTFVAGERAQAAHVNQNFTATAGAINENAAALSVVLEQIATLEEAVAALQSSAPTQNFGGVPVYSAGQAIGIYLDHGEEARLLSPNGYVFHATMIDHDPSSWQWMVSEAWLKQKAIFFDDANCMGDAYVDPSDDGPYDKWETEHGLVFRSYGAISETAVYYVPRSAAGALQPYNSVLYGSTCGTVAGERILWPALLNDEAVTGVPNAPYAKPFKLGLP